jgi:hypothetical protein
MRHGSYSIRNLYQSSDRALFRSLAQRRFASSLSGTYTRASSCRCDFGYYETGRYSNLEAVHFGIKQHLTTQITAYERPYRFTDEMLKGAFHDITHLHEFVPKPPGTLMIDLFEFHTPLGFLGTLAETLFLTRYMKGLLLTRNRYLKQVAEAGTNAALL